MSLLAIRAVIKPDVVDEAEAAARELFAAVERQQPENVRYGSCRLADGRTFLIMLQVDEGTENPLPALPEFRRFQEGLGEWVDGEPEAGPAEIVGSYRLF